ncbi:MAG: sensor histidine kinase [Planctomycetes bacterium]|nr:sensor histidine kinase [Planctomycetota bacterium]NOG53750.1 HAMP domain-containing histidine kinase [Planctomycetota bacterium]
MIEDRPSHDEGLASAADVDFQPGPLFRQTGWFIRLRWFAGAAVIAGSAVNMVWLTWYEPGFRMLLAGVGIWLYNAVFWHLHRSRIVSPKQQKALVGMAGAQILLDLTVLTLLTMFTNGVHSPLMGFYVFHMVFASLLLPRMMAWSGATVAMLMLFAGLLVFGYWPLDAHELPMALGWAAMLLLTVYVANQITNGLQQQHRRLVRKNRRIRAMTKRLKDQQRAMIQHEKMVAMGQLAAGVAHEIANPLACMDSVLQLMQRRPEAPRPDSVKTLREQVDRVNIIVKQMTEFAHVEEGQWEERSINEIVEQALRMVRFDRRLQGVKVERRLHENPGRIRLMPHALNQIILNLVINALDALSKTPDPTLTLETSVDDGWHLIRVRDNGSGIAPDNLDRIFEPFFTTKPVGQGTGLGLSISFKLVQDHGGLITAESAVDRGTTFTVQLPASNSAPRRHVTRRPVPGEIEESLEA